MHYMISSLCVCARMRVCVCVYDSATLIYDVWRPRIVVRPEEQLPGPGRGNHGWVATELH